MRPHHLAYAFIGAAFCMLACGPETTPSEPVPPPAPPPANPPPPPQPPPPPPAPGALGMTVSSGDQQSGTVGSALSQPLVIKVTRQGIGVEQGQVVTFQVTAGGGSLSAGADTTGADGLVQTVWTLGTRAGDTQKVEVRAVDHVNGAQVPALTLKATGAAAAPANLTVAAGQDVHGDAGDPVDVNPSLQLKDRYGNPTPGVTVKFAVTSGNGSVSGGDAKTDDKGVATVGDWTIGTQGGDHELTATATGDGIAGNPAKFKYTFCDCWTSSSSWPQRGSGLGAVGLNGKLYVIGGYDTWYNGEIHSYDPAIRVWTFEAGMSWYAHSTGVASARGQLFILGGQAPQVVGDHTERWTLDKNQMFDPAARRVDYRESMPTKRQALAATAVGDIIYAAGGTYVDETTNSGDFATFEAYNAANNTWTTKAPMPTPRTYLGVAAVDGIIYAIGGYRNASAVATVEAYDPSTGKWTTKKSMPEPRGQFGIAVIKGQIYVIGGTIGPTETATVISYNPKKDRWKTRASMPTNRAGLAAATLDGLIYAVGGINASGNLTTVEVYKP